ncbi:glycosyltransferase family 2 protein [Nitrosopumilus cobalaminigenes]|uniref:glycosyltransferase family 2 protein n=1 Tax=Nitrosopumilus cobalaminigenes TaxID=1470066 RepID=UPI0015CB19E2|nr:glycosyltransferase family 2 protein [Nitrosopumilus cobalaminigenes]
MNESKLDKLNIGLPVYNGEQFIRKRLENILSQTYSDFKLIIDVDPGTDKTVEICKEFAEKDPRIELIVQEKRMGWMWSFNFVFKQANSKYFVWAGVDDIWSSDFLEKNIAVLDSNEDVVGSQGLISHYGPWGDEFESKSDDSIMVKFYKKFRRSFRPFVNSGASGTFEQRVKIILRKTAYYHVYGVFRTNSLYKKTVREFFCWDWATVLTILKKGNFHLIDEVLIELNTSGASDPSITLFTQLKTQKAHKNEYLLPYSSFTIWCAKNLGMKIFFKNLDYFLWLNCILGVSSILISIMSSIKKN